MREVKLSIIVPVYNKELFVKRCILSILSQSYRNFELIVIDDGSTDQSRAIIESITYNDKRVNFYSFANAGVSSARNKGLKLAKGEYILFIDADDWIETNYLEHILLEIEEHPADLFLWGITKDYPQKQEFINPQYLGLVNTRDFLLSLISEQYIHKTGLYGYVANKLLKLTIIKKYNIAFNENIRQLEDYCFFLDYYKHCEKAYIFSELGYHYVSDTLFSSVRYIRKIDYLAIIQIHLKCVNLLQDNKCLTSDNIQYLQDEIKNLFIASFLDMNPINKKEIHRLLEFSDEVPFVCKALQLKSTNFRLLIWMILRRRGYLIYLYLYMWRIYLTFRK